jgi:hypothetical protein
LLGADIYLYLGRFQPTELIFNGVSVAAPATQRTSKFRIKVQQVKRGMGTLCLFGQCGDNIDHMRE